MPGSESIESLALELAAMAPRARAAILRSLSSVERQMLASGGDGSPRASESIGADRFSPWLAMLIEQARAGPNGGEAGRLTTATRQALLRSADGISGNDRPRGSGQGATGRSLFDAMGGFLSPRRVRP
ncbi:MAG: hypothetical protein WC729_11340 [Sphingomonas sp.]|jgi:hypothetical protein|uniref:hypothetical protein n=1 Tax=Sphingomonas sp. TaxID=28214 RepID=UPI003565E839